MSAGRSRASPSSATSAESGSPVENLPTQAPQGAKPPPTIAPEDSLFNDTPRVSQDVALQEAPLPAVSGYDIFGILGRGGMGVVYKARHQSLKRLVALKMIVAGAHASPDQLARFRTEAEAVARLQHPNIVQIYEIGEQGGLPFFSLEFVDGGSLAEKLAGTPQPSHAVAELVLTLARAIEEAHQAGIVHRDLKPANVLLTKTGVAKITDFGLAKQLESPTGQTQSGAILGTPSYMAPEQAAGKIKDIGRATDVYALGAILYEMMTGWPPFKAATPMDTIMQVIAEEPIAPTRFQKKLPRDLVTICLKCLQKEPAKRYASAERLAADLRRFLNHEPIQARRMPFWERGWKWGRRRPMAVVVGLGLLLSVLGVLYSRAVIRDTVQNMAAENYYKGIEAYEARQWKQAFKAFSEVIRLQPNNGEALFYRGVLFIKKHDFEKAADDFAKVEQGSLKYALAQAYLTQVELLNTNIDMKAFQNPMTLKEALGLLYESMAARKRELAIMVDQDAFKAENPELGDILETAILFPPYPRTMKVAEVLRFAVSKVDSSCRYIVKPHVIWLTTQTKADIWVLTLKGHREPVTSVCFSPDGKQIVSGSAGFDMTVKVWDAVTGQETLAFKGHSLPPINSVAFSPDGKCIVSASADSVKVWDAGTGRETLTLGHTAPFSSVAFSPGGKHIVSGGYDRTVKVWDAATGQETLTLKGHSAPVRSVAFTPDGTHIVSAINTLDATVKIWDAITGEEILTFTVHTAPVTSMAFSPDGKRIVSASVDGTLKVWDAIADEEILTFKGHTAPVSSMAFSPDGKRIVSGSEDGTLKVWDAIAGEAILTFKGHTAPVSSIAFSPDGKRIVSGCADGTLNIWDTTTD